MTGISALWETVAILRGMRLVLEGGLVIASGLLAAVTIADEYVSILVTLILAIVGGIVWLIRLEGRVTLQENFHDILLTEIRDIKRNLDRRHGRNDDE